MMIHKTQLEQIVPIWYDLVSHSQAALSEQCRTLTAASCESMN